MPSGIADLIGVRDNGMVVVVEVKNVPINKAAVLQVCRYALDLKYIVNERMDYPHMGDGNEPAIEMILIGPSIDDQTFYEAQAVNVRVFQFDVEFTLDVNSMGWSREHYSRLSDQRRAIADKPEWAVFGLTMAEDYKQYKREQIETGEDEIFKEIEKLAREYAATRSQNEHGDEIPTDADESMEDPF